MLMRNAPVFLNFLLTICAQNLFPVQIENRLHFNPSIREAAVVAVPDTRYGEAVGAFVERQPNSLKISKEEVRQWVSEGMNPQV